MQRKGVSWLKSYLEDFEKNVDEVCVLETHSVVAEKEKTLTADIERRGL